MGAGDVDEDWEYEEDEEDEDEEESSDANDVINGDAEAEGRSIDADWRSGRIDADQRHFYRAFMDAHELLREKFVVVSDTDTSDHNGLRGFLGSESMYKLFCAWLATGRGLCNYLDCGLGEGLFQLMLMIFLNIKGIESNFVFAGIEISDILVTVAKKYVPEAWSKFLQSEWASKPTGGKAAAPPPFVFAVGDLRALREIREVDTLFAYASQWSCDVICSLLHRFVTDDSVTTLCAIGIPVRMK